jgi:leucyl-tRNA synthetase
MEYDFKKIEDDWKKYWVDKQVYRVTEDAAKPKYYVLDMFPYPSGAGLHVGHPLGYVASDIFARYKRLKGFNVLHPMGFDAFGLPAEQYAIETGTHPAVTTEKAIARYKEQMDKIGFSYDWSRCVQTNQPAYYKWTQWIFLQLFGSWYNRQNNKAEAIETLTAQFEAEGCTGTSLLWREGVKPFTAHEWNGFDEAAKQQVLMHYRLAYLSYAEVNWCAALGTVLANDEVKDGKSERGGHPVERKKMRQWFLRITEYSDRLLEGLDKLDWSEAMKDMQRNWIGRSEGAEIEFRVLTPNPSPRERGKSDVEKTDEEPKEIGKPGIMDLGDTPKFMTGRQDVSKENIIHARENRRNPTKAEEALWEEIRGERLGFKFRRQHLIDKYIVDFVCLQKGLIIEADGASHDLTQTEDEERTSVLTQKGFTVIRFTNDEILNDTLNVLFNIKKHLTTLPDRDPALIAVTNWEPDDETHQPLRRRGAIGEDANAITKEKSDREAHPPLLRRGASRGEDSLGADLKVFTTRPDTIFGATFMVISPEHELLDVLVTPEQKTEIDSYLAYVKGRTDVERQQEKKVTGAFTGSYAVNPFTNKQIPVWIAEYVLSGYGTGAIMAVPADDERDRKFAEKFGLEIIDIIDKSMYPGATIEDKVGKMINSDFLDGMEVKDAIQKILHEIEERGIGNRKVNYRQRDAGYSRQRYWGEPFPIKYNVVGKPDGQFEGAEHDDIPTPLDVHELPLVLPEVSTYKPTGDGRSPLANNEDWVKQNYETDTMPGYAGSSWYFFRYMDPENLNEFASKQKMDYWKNVDLYVGGTEHAVGHLLYARLWTKFLFDRGYVSVDEPFQKLVNQGMIQGRSSIIYRIGGTGLILSKGFVDRVRNANEAEIATVSKEINAELKREIFSSKGMLNYIFKDEETGEVSFDVNRIPPPENPEDKLDTPYEEVNDADKGHLSEGPLIKNISELHVPIEFVKDDILDWEKLRRFGPERYKGYEYITESGKYYCGSIVEKMSKSKYNVITPDDVIAKHGADCFRMFEMFLGPIEQSKPWDDKGISGVSNFLRKFWRLFFDEKGWKVNDDKATDAELKILHKTLKKVSEDVERLSFNTAVSSFMIATNELGSLNCTKRQVLEPLVIALAPFAPFITEELWAHLGHDGSIHQTNFPAVEEKYLVENEHDYPVSINGKVRAQIKLPLDLLQAEVQERVMQLENVKKWTDGTVVKKFIFVKGKIINIAI